MGPFKKLLDAYGQAETFYGFITSDFCKQWVIPWAAPVLTLLSGYITPIPLPYLLVAACAAFFLTMAGLLRYDEWRQRTDPSGKVAFVDPGYYCDFKKLETRDVLERFQLGVIFKNNFTMPVKYEVEKLTSRFAGRVHSGEEKKYQGEIEANSTHAVRDAAISLTPEDFDLSQEGRLQFKISYWINSNKKYSIERSMLIYARYLEGERRYVFEHRFATVQS